MLLESARVVRAQDDWNVAERLVFFQAPTEDVTALTSHQLNGEKDDIGADLPQGLNGAAAIGHLGHRIASAFQARAQLRGE